MIDIKNIFEKLYEVYKLTKVKIRFCNWTKENVVKYKYFIYDTFFGASEGLKKFKIKLGYKAYKVEWLWG